MDEVPLTFDCPPNRTVDVCGAQSVSITTTGHEKTSLTVVLACKADGSKMKPMLIFKRKTMPKCQFPSTVFVCCNEKGWMREDVMILWLQEIWKKRSGSFFNPKGLLLFDSMKAHIQENVKEAATKPPYSATLAVIPGGLTKKLQPLDIAVNRSFKNGVRKRWETWMSSGLHTNTK